MSAPADFTDNENALARGLIRKEIRRQERRRIAGVEKFGALFDETQINGKIALLDSMYAKLGGDPDNITFMEHG